MEAIDSIPRSELEARWARVRALVAQELPDVQGIMIFSRTLMY